MIWKAAFRGLSSSSPNLQPLAENLSNLSPSNLNGKLTSVPLYLTFHANPLKKQGNVVFRVREIHVTESVKYSSPTPLPNLKGKLTPEALSATVSQSSFSIFFTILTKHHLTIPIGLHSYSVRNPNNTHPSHKIQPLSIYINMILAASKVRKLTRHFSTQATHPTIPS